MLSSVNGPFFHNNVCLPEGTSRGKSADTQIPCAIWERLPCLRQGGIRSIEDTIYYNTETDRIEYIVCNIVSAALHITLYIVELI